MDLFQQTLLLLGCSVVFVSVFQRLHLPPILGYIAVGMLLGPDGLKWVADRHNFHFLAEFGVVFLMFTIGLEFSLARMVAMRKTLLGMGGTQVLLCTLIAFAATMFVGLNAPNAFVIAAAFALSSTAVVIKQLTEQSEVHHEHGRISVSILIFQDLAAILFLIIVPALGAGKGSDIFVTLSLTMLKGIIAFAVMYGAGHWILRPLFHEVARSRSSELFMLAALVVTTAAAWLTEEMGLSLALGAFLAGMMLGETEYRHQLESDIRPFRDALLGLFFITVGMMVNLQALPDYWHIVLLLVVLLVVLKTAVIMLLTHFIAKKSWNTSLSTGLILAQSGEFGFAILTLATNDGILPMEYNQVVLAAIVVSMAICPIIIKHNQKLSRLIIKTDKDAPVIQCSEKQKQKLDEIASREHVIMCGYGRVGQTLTRFLDAEGIPVIALDLDAHRISEASLAGEYLFYGDATRLEILEAAGLQNAKMVVISFENNHAALEILRCIREVSSTIPVLVRARTDKNINELMSAGATSVVPELLEASLMLAAEMLQMLGATPAAIFEDMFEKKRDRYQFLKEYFPGEDDILSIEEDPEPKRLLHTLYVPEDTTAIGQVLSEFLSDTGCEIHAFIRNGIRSFEPAEGTRISEGDVIVVCGDPDQIQSAENQLRAVSE